MQRGPKIDRLPTTTTSRHPVGTLRDGQATLPGDGAPARASELTGGGRTALLASLTSRRDDPSRPPKPVNALGWGCGPPGCEGSRRERQEETGAGGDRPQLHESTSAAALVCQANFEVHGSVQSKGATSPGRVGRDRPAAVPRPHASEGAGVGRRDPGQPERAEHGARIPPSRLTPAPQHPERHAIPGRAAPGRAQTRTPPPPLRAYRVAEPAVIEA
jgi:hypothetical protein